MISNVLNLKERCRLEKGAEIYFAFPSSFLRLRICSDERKRRDLVRAEVKAGPTFPARHCFDCERYCNDMYMFCL